jgi:dephospho-CoA kinase
VDDKREEALESADTLAVTNRGKPYVIGLTGNIATGKTTVMGMLRHLGARIVDADQLAHEVMAPNTSAWQKVVNAFGRGILDDKGAIVRAKLGEIVFNDAKALATLEAIVHPMVTERVQQIMTGAEEPVLVVEAIKLIESGLVEHCDTLWVVTCRRQQQLERLMEQRFLREDQARTRVAAQPPQAEKIFRADVVIDNSGTLEQTWAQVRLHWQKVSALIGDTAPALAMRRATREDVPALARFLASMDWRGKPPNEDAARARVMGRAHWLLFRNNRVIGMASWEAINLVACMEEIAVGPEPDADDLLCRLAAAVEGEAKILQCESVIVTFPPGVSAQWDQIYEICGYRLMSQSELPKPWKDVVEELAPTSRQVTVKRLR